MEGCSKYLLQKILKQILTQVRHSGRRKSILKYKKKMFQIICWLARLILFLRYGRPHHYVKKVKSQKNCWDGYIPWLHDVSSPSLLEVRVCFCDIELEPHSALPWPSLEPPHYFLKSLEPFCVQFRLIFLFFVTAIQYLVVRIFARASKTSLFLALTLMKQACKVNKKTHTADNTLFPS